MKAELFKNIPSTRSVGDLVFQFLLRLSYSKSILGYKFYVLILSFRRMLFINIRILLALQNPIPEITLGCMELSWVLILCTFQYLQYLLCQQMNSELSTRFNSCREFGFRIAQSTSIPRTFKSFLNLNSTSNPSHF